MLEEDFCASAHDEDMLERLNGNLFEQYTYIATSCVIHITCGRVGEAAAGELGNGRRCRN